MSKQSAMRSNYKAIAVAGWDEINLAQLAGPYLSRIKKNRYWTFGVDGTPQKRQFAYTLSDRGYVYYPNPLEDIYRCYPSRTRLEHFFRFGKQKLSLNTVTHTATARNRPESVREA
jgi:hypothetical protein